MLLCLLSALGPLSLDLYLPALPWMNRELGAAAADVQLTLIVSSLGLGLGQLFFGPLSDRFGRRTPLLIGLTLFTVFSALCAIAPTLSLLVIARLGQGLGASAGLVISRAIVRDVFPPAKLKSMFGALAVASSLAAALGPLMGGLLIGALGWRGVFFILAVTGAVIASIAAVSVTGGLEPAGAATGVLRSFAIVLGDIRFVVAVAAFSLGFALLYVVIATSPTALQSVHGFSPLMFGVTFGVFSLTIATGTIIPMRQVMSGLAIAVLIAGCGAASVVVSAATGTLPSLVLGFGMICLAWGMVAPTTTTLALARHPDHAGAAAAVQGAAQFLVAGAVGPFLAVGSSALVGVVGLVTVVLVGILAATGAALAMLSRRPAVSG